MNKGFDSLGETSRERDKQMRGMYYLGSGSRQGQKKEKSRNSGEETGGTPCGFSKGMKSCIDRGRGTS